MTTKTKSLEKDTERKTEPDARRRAEYRKRNAKTHPPIQQAAGNLAVQRSLKAGLLQPKLTVGTPKDAYEQEADRLADELMRMPDSEATANAPIQTEDDETGTLRTETQPQLSGKWQGAGQTGGSDAQPSRLPPDVESRLSSLEGAGHPLPETERSFFESRLGANLSGVRTSSEPRADPIARRVNARAFAVGQQIFFKSGEYTAGSTSGRRLLAHELVHTIQQGGGKSGQRRAFGAGQTFGPNAGRVDTQAGLSGAARVTSSAGPRLQRSDDDVPERPTPIQRTVDEIVDRLEGHTDAEDSRYILNLFRGISPAEQRVAIHELRGRAGQMHESTEGPLYRLFEDLEEEDKVNLAFLLMANGVLSQGMIARLLVGRTWAGRWMPVTTEAGTEAAQSYADLVVEGQRRGGVGGFFHQAGGWIGGFFASLWTPETASETVIALSLARYAQLFPRAIGAPAAVLGSAQTGLSIGQLITGHNLWGEPLSDEERVRHWILAATGVAVISGGVVVQYGTPRWLGGRAVTSELPRSSEPGTVRVMTPEEVAAFHRNNRLLGRHTTADGLEVEVYGPSDMPTTALQLPEALPRPLPPPPRPQLFFQPAVGGRTQGLQALPPGRGQTPVEPLEPHPVCLGPSSGEVSLPLGEARTPVEPLEPHPVSLEAPAPDVLTGADVGTYGRTGMEFHLYTTAEVAFGMRTNFDPVTRLPRSVEYTQVAPTGETLPPRPSRFRMNEMISREYQLTHEAYTGTEYERGHLMPREAAASYPEALRDIDVMSNIAPMFGRGATGINQSVWRSYENLAMEQAQRYGWIRVRIEVIRGPAPPAMGAAGGQALSEVVGYTRSHYSPDGELVLGVSVPNR